MWIGTCDGLNIYDGQEIEEFKTRDKEDYLSGNLIDNIVYTGDEILLDSNLLWTEPFEPENQYNHSL